MVTHFSGRWPPVRAPSGPWTVGVRTGLLFLVLVIGLLSGCDATGSSQQVAGAQSNVRTGPTAVVLPTLPTLQARLTATATSGSVPTSSLQGLARLITTAVARSGRVPPHVQVGFRDGSGKIVVAWVINTDVNDTAAKKGVRDEALKIMALVKASGIDGSVLLSATGSTAVNVSKRVLWARFTRGTMRRTEWGAVSPASIFTLCDKPAQIEPGFG